jgi:hypothetical protein
MLSTEISTQVTIDQGPVFVVAVAYYTGMQFHYTTSVNSINIPLRQALHSHFHLMGALWARVVFHLTPKSTCPKEPDIQHLLKEDS